MSSIALVIALLQACAPANTSRTLHVYAASSLAESFAAMEHAFEAAHPGTDVVLAFAGSQVLRLQIEQGAPADVFASAKPPPPQASLEPYR
ncbi:MAG: extracellular solute-binding protein, partial [Gammaproteobacteria bacterium]|nr:extracellular solute-binding protein [Gammaproteobacteria bacterium]